MELDDIFLETYRMEEYRMETTPTFEEEVNWEELKVDEDTPISVLLLFINSLNKRLCELEKQNNLQKNFFKVTSSQEKKDEH